MVYDSHATEDTMRIGEQLGGQASEGQIFCLVGDLGVGKTVFTKGFAKALGIEEITSPTFTIVNEHMGSQLPFYHFDVYRIMDIEEMDEIGYEDYFFGEGVTFIEWANFIEEVIPDDAIWIFIDKELSKGTEYRKISVVTKESKESKE